MLRLFILLLLPGMLSMVHSNKKDLQLPALENGLASPGKRVAVVPAEYEGTGVHHLLYLPPDWDPDWQKKGRSWPVIVEYTGNRFPTSGSSGKAVNHWKQHRVKISVFCLNPDRNMAFIRTTGMFRYEMEHALFT